MPKMIRPECDVSPCEHRGRSGAKRLIIPVIVRTLMEAKINSASPYAPVMVQIGYVPSAPAR